MSAAWTRARTRSRTRVGALALVAPLVLLGVACGGDDGGSGGDEAELDAAVDGALEDAGLDTDAGAEEDGEDVPVEAQVGGLDMCSLLETAEVEANFSDYGAVAFDEAGSGSTRCEWALGDYETGSGWIVLEHTPLEGSTPQEAYELAVPEDGEPVDGLGEQAQVAPSPNGMRWTVTFVEGPWVMTVRSESSRMTAAGRDQVVAVAGLAAERL